MAPQIEPRFEVNPSEMLMRVLEKQTDTGEHIGEIRADIRNLHDGLTRLEHGQANMGTCMDQKLTGLKDDIDGLRVSLRGYNTDRDKMCASQDARIATLEHDKSYAKGAGMTAKVVLGVVGTGAVALMGLLANWVARTLGQI